MALDRSKNYVQEINMADIDTPNITIGQFRDLALRKFVSSGPGINEDFLPTTNELNNIGTMLHDAVSAGKLIDFGHWPNDFIKRISARGADLYHEGALGHPFSTPWAFYHTWDDPIVQKWGMRASATAMYLVYPLLKDNGSSVGCDFEVTALESIAVDGTKQLAVGDRGVMTVTNDRPEDSAYSCHMIPVQFRFPQNFWDSYAEDAGVEKGYLGALRMAAANVMEPVFVALLLMNTRGVPSETIRANDKVNKARIKNNKPPIPPYTRIDSLAYVTTVMRSPSANRMSLGGKHASPVAHVRHGHWRHYQSGTKTFINDTLVNATDEMRRMFSSNRTHYIVKRPEE